MYKEKGFNPEGHDWYWVKYKPGGDVQMEGKVELCIECHEGMVENDYVFTGSIVFRSDKNKILEEPCL